MSGGQKRKSKSFSGQVFRAQADQAHHCGLLCLASLSYHDIFKIHSCCSMYQYFIPCYCQIIFHLMDISDFIHSSVNRHLGCFHILTIVNTTTVNIAL